MPIRDTAAQNASLDNDYGTTAGPNAPASHDLALFAGDPMDTGTEITGGGYSRVTILPADWALASAGAKTLNNPVQFPSPSGAWSDTATHWALMDGSVMWDSGPLSEGLDVTAASTEGPLVSVSVFYSESIEEP